MNYIIKRDGRKVEFNSAKIVNAVLSAFKQVDGELSDYALEKANNIANYIKAKSEGTELTVEEIQDFVESGLSSTKRKDVAKAYILYREKRTRDRNWKSNITKIIHEKLNAENVQNSNANMDENSFGGRKGEATNVLLKQYALDYCMSEKSKNNHLNNEIYIHKLNCA